jgi:hypothetical protein
VRIRHLKIERYRGIRSLAFSLIPTPLQFADDAPVSPVRILAGEPQDQRAQRWRERRPARRPVRIGPAAGDQLPMPAKQRLRRDGEAGLRSRQRERLSVASSARSLRVSFGCRACRRKIASSWRRMRISNSFERPGRASSHTSANRVPNDEIHERPEQAALPRPRHDEPNEPAAPESRRRVCEPYAAATRPEIRSYCRAASSHAWPSSMYACALNWYCSPATTSPDEYAWAASK